MYIDEKLIKILEPHRGETIDVSYAISLIKTIAKEHETEQCDIPIVSNCAFKDELLRKTESMIWFARENYNKEYYEGVLNAMRNMQVHINKIYKKHCC